MVWGLAACNAEESGSDDPETVRENLIREENTPQPQRPANLPTVQIEDLSGDGTLTLNDDRRARLIGVSLPPEGAPFHAEARDYLREQLNGQPIGVQTGALRQDEAGRAWIYAWRNGALVNHDIIQAGFAHYASQPPNTGYDSFFIRAERLAAEGQNGLWRAADLPLQIDTVFIPAASDERVPFVRLRNVSEESLSLAGAQLRDLDYTVYPFGDVTLEAYNTLTVYVRCGRDQPREISWCGAGPVWDGVHDIVFLSAADQRYIDHQYIPAR